MRPSGDEKSPIQVYENTILLEASTSEEAMTMAREIGAKEAALDDDLTVGDAPAIREFAGVRKLIRVSNPHPLDLDKDRPISGTEISYSLYEVADRSALRALAEGERVRLEYLE